MKTHNLKKIFSGLLLCGLAFAGLTACNHISSQGFKMCSVQRTPEKMTPVEDSEFLPASVLVDLYVRIRDEVEQETEIA